MGRFVLPLQQVFTLSGRLGAGYRLSFFESGTSTPLDTFSDEARTVANSNPVVADAEGRFPSIWLLDQPYKVVLADDDDVLIWTADPVSTAVGEIGMPVPIAKGGTGATDVPGVFTALGLGDAATYTVGDGADELPTNSMIGGVPVGGIILWSGSLASVPAGWHACDGGTYSKVDGSGTITVPDLRDRFVVGATSTYAQGSSGGSVAVTTGASGSLTMTCGAGGDHNHSGATDGHTLTIAQMPAHTHPISPAVPPMGTGYGYTGVNGITSGSVSATQSTGGGGSHSHGIQASGTHTHSVTGGDHTHSISSGLPPYYALIYICKL